MPAASRRAAALSRTDNYCILRGATRRKTVHRIRSIVPNIEGYRNLNIDVACSTRSCSLGAPLGLVDYKLSDLIFYEQRLDYVSILSRSGCRTRTLKRPKRRDGGVSDASEEKKVSSATKSEAYNAVGVPVPRALTYFELTALSLSKSETGR